MHTAKEGRLADEVIIRYYRKLLKTGFQNAGSFDAPSIFLHTTGEGRVCGPGEYMHIFINISNGKIDGVKYLCTCDPTANVAVEILCTLLKGKRIEEAKTITEDSFFKEVGGRSEKLRLKAIGLLELLNGELTQYRTENASQ